MTTPVLLVSGFLGAGKTTLVNHLLAHADGRRIAAVVNDFGALDIDAGLIAGAEGGVVSLRNGCICCALEGDLLRTLSALLRRDPPPDAVVIETSGVADPAGVVRTLMDPAIWRAAPLDTVLCVVDATRPDLLDDPLLRAQLRSADLVVLNKADLVATDGVRARVAATRPAATIVEAVQGRVPTVLLFSDAPPTPRAPGRTIGADRWESVAWTAPRPLRLAPFRAALERLAPRLARAKGVIAVEGRRDRLLLQLVGGRATLSPAPMPEGGPPVRLVFIAELGCFAPGEIAAALAGCVADSGPVLTAS